MGEAETEYTKYKNTQICRYKENWKQFYVMGIGLSARLPNQTFLGSNITQASVTDIKTFIKTNTTRENT